MLKKVGWILSTLMSIHAITAGAPFPIPLSDPFYENQEYLKMVKADQAWKYERENQDLVIAVLDTGVDLDHPDLKSNLVPGFNLLSSEKPPEDDQGHGSATAGILAASGNNETGIAGILWKAKVMPVKVLDHTGNGEAKRVAQGIRLAVDQGAKIILLSLGDPIYSMEMEKAVGYAEEKGVLVISATGNDGNRVNYPGAFPTVLSVGAVDQNRQVLSYSNSGPEVDLVAPGYQIYTTAKGGGYASVSGTSMAAPQVAGIAALILKKNPELTPAQVRALLQSTATDLGEKGWDEKTGYGLIDAKKALEFADHPPTDRMEPNNTLSQSSILPVIAQLDASAGGTDPVDWYTVKSPYNGKILVSIEKVKDTKLQLSLYDEHQKKIRTNTGLVLEGTVPKGKYYLEIRPFSAPHSVPYTLNVGFHASQDGYETNDDKKKAKKLSPVERIQLQGNFHRPDDEDWFQANYPWAGKLEVEVSTDTLRMDPVLTIEQEGKWKETVDQGSVSNRQKESWSSAILPGSFYFGLKDYYHHAINGEYTLSIHYQPQPSKWFQDITYHWARSDIEYLVEKHLIAGYSNGHFSPDQPMKRGEAAVVLQRVLHLPNGKESFRDSTSSYWATSSLAALVEKGILKVDDKNNINPEKKLTRAEVATILARAKFGEQVQGTGVRLPFKDIESRHGAYPYIAKMYQAGFAKGISETQFAPDQLTTRAEFASLLKRMWFK